MTLQTPLSAMVADLIKGRADTPLTALEAAMILRRRNWTFTEIALHIDAAIRATESFQQTAVDNCRSKL